MIFMIIESIIGIIVVATVAYLYWKSVEKEMNDSLPISKPESVVTEPEVKIESFKIEPAIAEAVVENVVETEKPADKPKRARRNGKFVADDKSTPDINEAWEDGKAPAKTTKTKTTKPKAQATTEKPVKKTRTRKPKMTVLK
jgi:hypothetical protein